LKCVGWNGNPEFDSRVFAEIYTASGGVPRRINQIANRLLLLGALDQSTRIDAGMLGQVLSELTQDGTLSLVRIQNKTVAPLPLMQPPQGEVQAEADVATAQFESALAARDDQIAELQQAVLELANAAENAAATLAPADDGSLAELNERIAALEGRLIEQDRTIRHTLTMLIEWIEADDAQRAAA